jgi:hypothetical protein
VERGPGRGRVRFIGSGLLFLLLLTQYGGSSPVAAQTAVPAEPSPVAASFAATVAGCEIRFHWRGDGGRAAALQCRVAFERRAGAVISVLVPPGARLRPIDCWLLSTEQFQAGFGDMLPDWGIGVALPGGDIVAIDCQRLPGSGRSSDEVFLHELVHALTFQSSAGHRLPTWFMEGTAMLLSGEWRFFDTVQLVLSGPLPALERLSGGFPAQAAWADQAYRTSMLAVDALRKWYGDDVIQRLVQATARTGDFQRAFLEVTGVAASAFSAQFARSLRHRFGWLFMIFRWPTLFVLMALLFSFGAVSRLIRNRRRLAEMPD